MNFTPEFPRESHVVSAYSSRQQFEITVRMPASQDQAPGAEPWGGEGMGVSQLRPPAIVCKENMQASSAASISKGIQFLMSKPLGRKQIQL